MIKIPNFKGSTAKGFRSHQRLLDTIFDTLGFLNIFEGKERYPTHSSTKEQNKYEAKSRRINRILTESFSPNLTCSSTINNRKFNRWRNYRKELLIYYDNETDLSSDNYLEILRNLHRNENEYIKNFRT